MFERQYHVVYEMIQLPGDFHKEKVGCAMSLDAAIDMCRHHAKTHGRFGEYEVYNARAERVWLSNHGINELSRDCLVAGHRY